MTVFTNQQRIDCIRREIAMRERVYPRWVLSGKLSPQKAEHEIACMEDVLAVLLALEDSK